MKPWGAWVQEDALPWLGHAGAGLYDNLRAVLAVAVSGAAATVSAVYASGNADPNALKGAAISGAVVGVLGYLKQSPIALPPSPATPSQPPTS